MPVFPVKCDVCKCDYSNRDNPVTDMACNPTISQNNNENSNTSQNGTGLPFCNNTGDLNYKSFNSGTGETAFIIRIFEEVWTSFWKSKPQKLLSSIRHNSLKYFTHWWIFSSSSLSFFFMNYDSVFEEILKFQGNYWEFCFVWFETLLIGLFWFRTEFWLVVFGWISAAFVVGML